MIEVRGLGNDIYELMLANAQNNIIQSVRHLHLMAIQVVW